MQSATEAVLLQRGLLAAYLNPRPSRLERRKVKQAMRDARRIDMKHRAKEEEVNYLAD